MSEENSKLRTPWLDPEPGSEPEPEAVVDEEPQPKRKPGWVNPPGMPPAALAASIQRSKEIRAKSLERTRELILGEFKDKPNATQLLAKRLGVNLFTARRYRRDAGVKGSSTTVGLAEKQDVPLPPPPLYTLKWTILQLFDTLRPFFQKITEAEQEERDAPTVPAPKKDMRLTWLAWRVFLAAAFGVDRAALDTDQSTGEAMPAYPGIVVDASIPRGAANLPVGASSQEIFERCTGRSIWPKLQSKIVSLIVGRRGGKSYITAIIGIYLACCRSYQLNLGTKGMVMILARDREQAQVIRRYVLAFLQAVPALRELLLDDPTQKTIELKNDITIEVRAVGEAGTRGYTVVAALMDEIAFWPTDPESAKQDKKVLRAIRPAMLGIQGAMIVMLSSPYAKRGELFEIWRKAFGKEQQTYLVWNADTLSMRPDDDPELLDEIRTYYEEDPDSAKAEYGGEFRSDLESIFSREAVEGVSIPGRFEQGYQKKYSYRAFVDPSGGSSDSYVIAIAHEEERLVGAEKIKMPVLDKVVEWKPKFDPQLVSVEIVMLCQNYHISRVTGDAYGGEWPRDPLRKRGIQYILSDKTRSELYLDFLPMVNSKRCELLCPVQHRRGVNQLSNLERRVGRTGKDSVDHQAGSHDDVANAIAGVMVMGASGVTLQGRAVWGKKRIVNAQ